MVMLAEDYDFVIGGDPDRDTIDLAVVDTSTGGVRGHIIDSADAGGYQRLLDWSREHAPGRRVWALEGTGSFAAGLVNVLVAAHEEVVEITGSKRSRGGRATASTPLPLRGRRCRGSSSQHHERRACGRRYGRS